MKTIKSQSYKVADSMPLPPIHRGILPPKDNNAIWLTNQEPGSSPLSKIKQVKQLLDELAGELEVPSLDPQQKETAMNELMDIQRTLTYIVK